MQWRGNSPRWMHGSPVERPAHMKMGHRPTLNVRATGEKRVLLKNDALAQIGAYKSCAAFIRAARKAGFGGAFHNVFFVGTQPLSDELGKDGIGVVVSQVMPSPHSAVNGLTRDFNDAARKAGNTMPQPNDPNIGGFMVARVLTEGVCRVPGGRITRDSLITRLESIERQSFGGFDVSFSVRNHVTSKFVELSMLIGSRKVKT